jgi:hypothetical protein
MDNTIRINGLTYDQWKLKLIQLIVDETIDLGSFLKLEEIKCVLSDDCDYPKSFIDGETPGIKVEELKYYADLIVDKMVEESRHHKAYWELYHWCKNHDVNKIDGFPYNSLRPYDTDWTKELRETVENIIKEKRPDLLEPKYNEPVA